MQAEIKRITMPGPMPEGGGEERGGDGTGKKLNN